MRSAPSWGIVVGVAVLLVACAPGGSPPSGTGQTRPTTGPKRVVVAAREVATVLSSRLSSNADVVEEFVSAGLVQSDPDRVLHPQLAEAVPSLENNLWKVFPDGRMETTWRIREGARWHDGTPVTADDLLFTVRVGQDAELPDFGHRGYRLLESLRAEDSRTVTAVWKAIDINADSMFSHGFALPLPSHLLEGDYLANKSVFTELPFWISAFVGTGPFKVREFLPGEHLLLEANADYALGRPKLDEIEVRFLLDVNTLIANVLAGAVHLTLGRALSVDQALQARDHWTEGKLAVYPSFGTLVLQPQLRNPDPPALGDVAFRRALIHAIDRQALMESIQGGLTAVTGFILTPGGPHYAEIVPSIIDYEYDHRKAIQLIEGLGYRRVDGTFRDGAARELSVEIMVPSGDDARERGVVVTADYWQRVGVKGVAQVIPQAQARDAAFRASRSGFYASGITVGGMSEAGRLTTLHSREIPVPENRYRGNNSTGYQNGEVDELIDRFFVTIPLTERVELFKRIARRVTEDAVYTSLFHTASPVLINNRLQNVTPRTLSSEVWNVHLWDVR